MKQILFILAVSVSLFACKLDDKNAGMSKGKRDLAINDTANFTSITWLDSTTTNLGSVKEGKVVEIAYRFKNTGAKNLVISDVTAGCGCTIPEKPEKPYAPGEEGVIKAKFNSQNHPGPNNKQIMVTANTNPTIQTLFFNIEVTQ
jgi:hypothetical protein